jgi:hypothetical protein
MFGTCARMGRPGARWGVTLFDGRASSSAIASIFVTKVTQFSNFNLGTLNQHAFEDLIVAGAPPPPGGAGSRVLVRARVS